LLGPIAKAQCRLRLAMVTYRMDMGNLIFKSSGPRHGYGKNSNDILGQHAQWNCYIATFIILQSKLLKKNQIASNNQKLVKKIAIIHA
jgi:hypothetical protein